MHLKMLVNGLLLGCNIGQRGGDLLMLDESNFVNRNGLEVIELKQQKTDKNVTIPVLAKTKEIIQNGLPYKISMQKFNKYIKAICKVAEINEPIEGGKITVLEKGTGKKERKEKLVELTQSGNLCLHTFAGVLFAPTYMEYCQRL